MTKTAVEPGLPRRCEWPLPPLDVEPPLRKLFHSVVDTISFYLIDPDEGGLSGFVFGVGVGLIAAIVSAGTIGFVLHAAVMQGRAG